MFRYILEQFFLNLLIGNSAVPVFISDCYDKMYKKTQAIKKHIKQTF